MLTTVRVNTTHHHFLPKFCSLCCASPLCTHTHTPAAVLERSRGFDTCLLSEGLEETRRTMLLSSQALAQCSLVQKTVQEW